VTVDALAIPLAALLGAYALGSLSGSLLLGRLRGVDIRTQGSGNAGGTNAFRTQGAWFALGTVAVDIAKGVLAAWAGLALAPEAGALAGDALGHACGLAAVIGHVWPVWHGFRGGKGAGTAVGALAVLWPLALAPLLATWLLVLMSTGYVGLATICAGLALLPMAWWDPAGPARLALSVALAGFLVFTHRSNLQRLAGGVEHRFERARVLARLVARLRGAAPR
jgi:glycerol-3-phosphate acyltransferase PlsY